MTESTPSLLRFLEGWIRVLGALALIAVLGLLLDWCANLPHFASETSAVAGLLSLGCGTLLEAYATVTFWKQGHGTPHPAFAPPHLVTAGPYRYSRNPLYLARITMLIGVSVLAGSIGILIATLLLVVGLQFVLIPREEVRLRGKFGVQYHQYQSRVPRWLISRGKIGATVSPKSRRR
jgi:protein-S-isoprenylcysteine O-methyltransferase Ste14